MDNQTTPTWFRGFEVELKIQTQILSNIEKHLEGMSNQLIPAATRQVGGSFFLLVVGALSVIIAVLVIKDADMSLAVGHDGLRINHEVKKSYATP